MFKNRPTDSTPRMILSSSEEYTFNPKQMADEAKSVHARLNVTGEPCTWQSMMMCSMAEQGREVTMSFPHDCDMSRITSKHRPISTIIQTYQLITFGSFSAPFCPIRYFIICRCVNPAGEIFSFDNTWFITRRSLETIF